MDTPPQSTRLFTLAEAATELRIGRDLLYRVLRDGDLPSVRIGGRRFIEANDLEAYIRGQRTSDYRSLP